MSTVEFTSLLEEVSLSADVNSNTSLAHALSAPGSTHWVLNIGSSEGNNTHMDPVSRVSTQQHLPLTKANLEHLSSSQLGRVFKTHNQRVAAQAGSNSALSSYVRVNTNLRDEEIEVIILLSQLDNFKISNFCSILMTQFGHTHQEASLLVNLAAAGWNA